MGRQAGVAKVVVAALLAAALMAPVAGVQAATWSDWSCQWAVVDYPVSAGNLDGLACARWWTGTEPWWQVWGETYVPYSTTIFTYVQGEDQCGGGSWTFQMYGSKYVSDASYGNIGIPAQGNYRTDCFSGHYYRAYYAGSRQATSSSPWEGTSSYVYF